MPPQDSSKDTVSIYRAGASWLVGLSGAAVGGAFLNFDKVAPAPILIRFIFFFAAVAFGLAVCFGVQYFFWLNYAANQTELKNTIDRKVVDAETTAGEKAALGIRLGGVENEINNAWNQIRAFNFKTQRAFEVGMALAGLLLLAGTIGGAACPKPAESGSQPQPTATNPQPYEIVLSAVHRTRHGREAHTFLLNRNTGGVWQMVCRKSDEVEFRRVHRVGFDGQPEEAGK